MQLVLSGTLQEARDFAESKGWKPGKWRWLSTIGMARGYSSPDVHVVGTWYNHRELRPMLTSLVAGGARFWHEDKEVVFNEQLDRIFTKPKLNWR